MVGELFFNGSDAFSTWGIIMGKGCFASLICPGAPKEYVTNESRTGHGIEYVCPEGARIDQRKFTMNLSIMASSRADLYSKIVSFSQNVLERGEMDVFTKYQQNVHYHCVYTGFNQLTEYNGRLATFTLYLTEINPANRVPTNVLTFDIDTTTAKLKYKADVTVSFDFVNEGLEEFQGSTIATGQRVSECWQEYDDFAHESGSPLLDLKVTATGSMYEFKTKIIRNG